MNASTLNQGTGQEPSCPPATTTSRVVDGVVFLRRQQASLSRLLRDAGDETRPDATTETTVHPEWLALIAGVSDAHGLDAAYRVTRLYEFHGRVIGSLERQRTLPLPPPAVQALRRLLVVRLAELTDDAVGALCPRP